MSKLSINNNLTGQAEQDCSVEGVVNQNVKKALDILKKRINIADINVGVPCQPQVHPPRKPNNAERSDSFGDVTGCKNK
jgi:hypothetical protein